MKLNKEHNTIYASSIFSSLELKIDKAKNLKISRFSLLKNESSIIPLDLINAEPSISKSPDLSLISLAFISFVTSAFLYFSSLDQNLFSNQLIAIFVFSLGLLALTASLIKHTKQYSFYYANTSIQLFKLKNISGDNSSVKQFVDQLSQRINSTKTEQIEFDNTNRFNNDKNDIELEFTEHLDYLYNYGIINDVLYERISGKISEKVYGIKPAKKELAEVIFLSTARN